MHVDRRLVGWGVFFVLIGAIPLAVQAGVLDREIAVQSWRLWPLLLVAAGVGLMLRGTRAATIGGVLVPVTIGIMGGGLLAGGGVNLGLVACGGGGPADKSFSRSGTLAASASVRLELRCGSLSAHTAPGSAWSLNGTADPDALPTVSESQDRLAIRSRDGGLFVPGFGSERERWDVALPTATSIDLSLTMSAGEATLDLHGGRFTSVDLTGNAGTLKLDLEQAALERIGVTLNAGDARIVLPDATVEGSMTVNAGSIRFCVPPGVGLRLHTNDNLTGSFDYAAAGLARDGSTWTSSNFATAANRIDLSTTANAGSFSLNPPEGCR